MRSLLRSHRIFTSEALDAHAVSWLECTAGVSRPKTSLLGDLWSGDGRRPIGVPPVSGNIL